ncbi:MAG TPA: ATP-binding protein [Bosea sp. (in: a-proteobacteria)]|jgi:hypothetical protein|uniref:sensor histidine kinase n=1 Tax=Bosea sp. (in: a-proteobacteria) TaxID=1871050 RepID=UPI002E0DF63D|nr:ATP-binding protein [Bosea sp. (in: a-proteobacteria)]
MSSPADGKSRQGPDLAASPPASSAPAHWPGLGLPAAVSRHWRALSLERKFLITAALAVGLSMATLGYWVEKRIRDGWVQGMAETGALYLEGFLSNHVQLLEHANRLTPESEAEIDDLLFKTNLGSRVAIIKIWDTSGNLVYSTNKSDSHQKMHPDYIARTLSGSVVIDTDPDDEKGEFRLSDNSNRLIEIYAPIYKRKTKDIIAIGEFYEFDTRIQKELYEMEFTTWMLIAFVTIVIVFLLYLIASRISRTIGMQQDLLEANLARAAALAKRNNALRRAADRARLNASALNETYLASIGADIHDGPIQILSLMMLKLPRASEQGEQPEELARTIRQNLEPLIQKTLAELRNLSAGLVLPEVEHLSPAETIDLAVTRHEEHTGTRVARDLMNLPKHAPRAIRVCAYRVIQEALNNSYKHAGGRGQRVTARGDGKMLEIAVADSGVQSSSQLHRPMGSTKLGLRGMESRVKALRGSLAIIRLQNGGTEIRASLPLRS